MDEVTEIAQSIIAEEPGARLLFISSSGMHPSRDFDGEALSLNVGGVRLLVALSQIRDRNAEHTVIDMPCLDRAAALLRQYGISYTMRPCKTRQCLELRAADGALLVLTQFS